MQPDDIYPDPEDAGPGDTGGDLDEDFFEGVYVGDSGSVDPADDLFDGGMLDTTCQQDDYEELVDPNMLDYPDPEAWKMACFNEAARYSGDDKLWGLGREIRVFRMPDVRREIVPYAISGIETLIDEIGLDINVVYYGVHSSVVDQVESAVDPRGIVDLQLLVPLLKEEPYRDPSEGGRPHADAIILDRYISYVSVDEKDWGASAFQWGSLFLALVDEEGRQNDPGFIRSIAKHEAGHLLGLRPHHDARRVGGYAPVADCNMLYQASTLETCGKCRDAITAFWQGLEQATGQNFFR